MIELVEALIGGIVGAAGKASDADRARIRALIADSLARLDAIEPNLPHIHALGEARREAIAAEHQRRADEATRETPVDPR